MSKKKRVRRDVDKLFRAGRHWELLRLLEKEDLVSENAVEHREAWKAVIKQALVREGAFEEFRREIGTVAKLPDSPDFRLLMSLKSFVEGRGPAEDILALKGLTPDAERLKSNFSVFVSSPVRGEKLRNLLGRFIREPQKITRRYFEQVADLIPESSLSESVRILGELVPAARAFNRKTAVDRGWAGMDLGRLAMLDRRLARATGAMPGALREILLHPFAQGMAAMCRRLAPKIGAAQALRLVRSMPFLLPGMAGGKLPEIEKKLLVDRGEWVEDGVGDLNALRKKVKGLSIEEKLTLLRELRLKVQNAASIDARFDDFDFPDDGFQVFDDDEDDDFPEGGGDPEELSDMLLVLYSSLMEDIRRRLGEQSARDKNELARIMEPILFRDIDAILEVTEGPEGFLGLMSAAIEAGCAGIRMALLSLLAGSAFRNSDLRKRAAGLLDRLPVATREDMEWLASEWSDFFYPAARSLKPLLDRYKNEKDLPAVFAEQLCKLLELNMVTSSLGSELRDFFPFPISSKVEQLKIMRRELGVLVDYDALDIVRQFLRCYPEDRLTVEGNLCLLNVKHLSFPNGGWAHASAELRRYRELLEGDPGIPQFRAFERLFDDKLKAALLFMKEHLDEFQSVPMDILGPFLEELLGHLSASAAHHTFLIQLEKKLAARVEAGEKDFRPLMDRIRGTLRDIAGRGRKTRATRKGRR